MGNAETPIAIVIVDIPFLFCSNFLLFCFLHESKLQEGATMTVSWEIYEKAKHMP